MLQLINWTSGTLAEKGFSSKAIDLALEAETLLDKMPACTDEQRLTVFNNIGYVINYNEDHNRAAPYYEKALRISREHLGYWHPSTIAAYHNMAGIHEKRRDLKKAEEFFIRAVDIGKRIHMNATSGEDPFASMASLASVYALQKRFIDAERLLREALIGFEERLGARSSWTLWTLGELGRVLLEPCLEGGEDRWAESEKILKKAAAGLEDVLGAEDRYTREAKENLARLCANDLKPMELD